MVQFSTDLKGIDLIYWNGRLNSALLVTYNALEAIKRKEFVEEKYEQWTAQADELASAIATILGNSEVKVDTKVASETLKRGIDDGFDSVMEHVTSTALNLGLVEQCSIFESALSDTLRRILINRPDVLTGLVKKEALPVEFLIKYADKPLNETLREWKLRSFSRESVEKKLIFFEHNFHISRKTICDPEHFGTKARTKFKGRGVKYVSDIFEMRHLIVHDLQRPIAKADDLNDCHEFLIQVLHALLWEVKTRFKLDILALGTKLNVDRGESAR